MNPKTLPVSIFALLLTSSFSGCLTDNDEKKFSWPEKVDSGCLINLESSLSCNLYIDGFETVIVSIRNLQTDELWIADLNGEISSWDGNKKTLVGNLSNHVSRCHNEQGLLGMVISESNEKVLLSYSQKEDCNGQDAAPLILADIDIVNGKVDTTSIRILKEIEQPFRNHNSGNLVAVGNNQYLWGIGDGGSANDPYKHGQNDTSELGTILLFEYNGNEIMPVNDDYILHYGLRNPWKFDIDSEGGLWIADVGQNCFEEVNYIEKWNNSSNFGWASREGLHNFDKDMDCTSQTSEPPEGVTDPVLEYGHTNGNCSVTGGVVVNQNDSLFKDGYIYGDFCSGIIWLAVHNNGSFSNEFIVDTDLQIAGFGRGLDNELLIYHWGGSIFSLE